MLIALAPLCVEGKEVELHNNDEQSVPQGSLVQQEGAVKGQDTLDLEGVVIDTISAIDSVSLGQDTSLLIYDTTFEHMFLDWQTSFFDSSECTLVTDSIPVFSKEVCLRKMSQLPNVFPLAYNDVVQFYIKKYGYKYRRHVSKMLGLSDYYFPMIEQILEENNVPAELKYLAVVESALNPLARSRVGAGGLWQFMPGTARMYGLKMNSLIDERSDPIKSTEAAAKYLSDLFVIYQDWNLVIAAYNCGPGNVNKAIRRSGGKKDYWKIYPYLPSETRSYVPTFLAANFVMHYHNYYKICPNEVTLPLFSDTVQVRGLVSYDDLSKALDISKKELRLLNPQYRRDLVPGHIRPSALRLPYNSVYKFLELQDSIVQTTASVIETQVPLVKIHRVRSGENLGVIARKYRVSVKNLKRWNKLRGSMIRVGQKLVVR